MEPIIAYFHPEFLNPSNWLTFKKNTRHYYAYVCTQVHAYAHQTKLKPHYKHLS